MPGSAISQTYCRDPRLPWGSIPVLLLSSVWYPPHTKPSKPRPSLPSRGTKASLTLPSSTSTPLYLLNARPQRPISTSSAQRLASQRPKPHSPHTFVSPAPGAPDLERHKGATDPDSSLKSGRRGVGLCLGAPPPSRASRALRSPLIPSAAPAQSAPTWAPGHPPTPSSSLASGSIVGGRGGAALPQDDTTAAAS